MVIVSHTTHLIHFWINDVPYTNALLYVNDYGVLHNSYFRYDSILVYVNMPSDIRLVDQRQQYREMYLHWEADTTMEVREMSEERR